LANVTNGAGIAGAAWTCLRLQPDAANVNNSSQNSPRIPNRVFKTVFSKTFISTLLKLPI
jgi:hypothetical protein